MVPGDEIIAEADAMASMSATIRMTTRWSGGMMKGIAKRVFGGESMFVNVFTAEAPGELILTQPFPGDIECIDLKGTTMFLQQAPSLPVIRASNWDWAGPASRWESPAKDCFA